MLQKKVEIVGTTILSCAIGAIVLSSGFGVRGQIIGGFIGAVIGYLVIRKK